MIAHVSSAKTHLVKFGIKILVKVVNNTESFTIFVLDNHCGFCLYFVDF